MCGRYVLFTDKEQEEILEIIKEVERKNLNIKEGDIYPTNQALVNIGTPYHHGKSKTAMKWGYTVPWSKKTLINARSETILQKNTFKKFFFERRRLVPAVGF